MTHLDMTGYSLAPRQFSTAGEVAENARRVLAFRQKGWMKPVHVDVEPAPTPKPEVVIPPPTGLLTMILWPDEFTGNNFTRPTIRQVARAVAHAFPTSYGRMIGPERFDHLVRPRQFAMALAKHLTLASYPAIGRVFGDRDHTTVLHAIRKMAPVISATAETLNLGSPLSEWVSASIPILDRLFPAKKPPRTKIGKFCKMTREL